jgi:hypothetical protein
MGELRIDQSKTEVITTDEVKIDEGIQYLA